MPRRAQKTPRSVQTSGRRVSAAELEAARDRFLRELLWPWDDQNAPDLAAAYSTVRDTVVAQQRHVEGDGGRGPLRGQRGGAGSLPAFAAAAARFDPDADVQQEALAFCFAERYRQLARPGRALTGSEQARLLGELTARADAAGIELPESPSWADTGAQA